MTPAMHLRHKAPTAAVVLFALSLPIFAQTASAPAATLKEGAKEPFQKGLLAAQQEDWKLAIRYFLEAQKADPDAPQPLFNLGLAEAQIPGRELRSIAWFQAYLALIPDAANAAQVRKQITDLDVRAESNARKLLEILKAMAAQSSNENYTRHIPPLLAKLRDMDGALGPMESTQYLADQGRFAEAIKLVERVPGVLQPQAYAHIALAQAKSGLRKDAAASWSRALKMAKQIPYSTGDDTRAFVGIASTQISAGLFADAKASLAYLTRDDMPYYLVTDHEIRDAYFNLAEAEYRSGKQDEAAKLVSDLRAAVNQHVYPEESGYFLPRQGALVSLAVFEFKIGQNNEADALLEQVKRSVDGMNTYEDRINTLTLLAHAAVELGRRQEALNLLREAEKGDRDAYSDHQYTLSCYPILRDYLLLQDWTEARAFILRWASNLGKMWAAESEEELSRAIAVAAKASARKSLLDASSSPSQRAQAWGDYTDAALNQPLFLDDFKTTLDNLKGFVPQTENYKEFSIFQNVRRPAEALVDRLRDVRDLQSAAAKK